MLFENDLQADQQYHDWEIPDMLSIAGAAGNASRSLRLLSLTSNDGWQRSLRLENGHSGLKALSALTSLTALQLTEAAIDVWPDELSQLTVLPILSVVDTEFSNPDDDLDDGDPIEHSLAALPHLHSLQCRHGFSSEQPLPLNLTKVSSKVSQRHGTAFLWPL